MSGVNGGASATKSSISDIEDRVRDLAEEIDQHEAQSHAAHDAMREAVLRLDWRLADYISARERAQRVEAAHWDALAEHTRTRERAQAEQAQAITTQLEALGARVEALDSRLSVVARAALLGGGGGAALIELLRVVVSIVGGG